MNKYSLSVASVVALALFTFPVFAQSPTSTPSGSLDEEVDRLKEIVAEQVEQRRNEKATAGIVESIEGNSWTLINSDGQEVSITIDDTLTEFFEIAGSRTTELDQDDIEVNNYVFITGPEIGGSITANAVYRDEEYIVQSGKITEANEDDFTIRVLTVDKTEFILDIERSTDQKMLDIRTLETSKIGFSKLKEGDSVHFVVKANPENPEQTRYSATRILVVPNEYFLQ